MFNDKMIYKSGDAALDVIGRPSTLARWRTNGAGPSYVKLGVRVAYRGEDLNAWIASRRVETQAR